MELMLAFLRLGGLFFTLFYVTLTIKEIWVKGKLKELKNKRRFYIIYFIIALIIFYIFFAQSIVYFFTGEGSLLDIFACIVWFFGSRSDLKKIPQKS